MTAYAQLAVPAPTPRASLWKLATVELRKMADTRAGFWLLLVTALMAVGIAVIIVAVGDTADQRLDELYPATLQIVSVLLPILGILAVTSEWSQRTALATFTLVPQRERVVAAKLLAGVVFATVASVICLLLSLLGAAIAGVSMSFTLGGFAAGLLYQALGMAMGMALGLALLSSPLAIVLYFVLPTIIAILVESISALNGVGDWIDTTRTFEPLVRNEMMSGDWGRLAVSTAVWLGIPMIVGLLRLRRSELK
jgi:ABC-2 type transport system permease protein